MEVDESQERRIKKLVEDIVTSADKEVDAKKMKTVKNMCKHCDEVISVVNKELFRQLKKNNSEIRLLCASVFDELFTRSHFFRTLVLENFDELTVYCIGIDSLKPLPLPAAAAKKLQSFCISMLKRWIDRYGEGYSKLKVCHEALKRRVNFDSCCLINDIDEMNRQREQERMETLWKGRILQVEKEVEENQEAVDRAVMESRNCVELWREAGTKNLEDPVTVAVCDQHNVLSKRLIPLCKKWTVTLTKAGRHTNHQLLRKCIELKKALDSVFESIVKLDIDYDRYQAERHVEPAKKKIDEEMLFGDPTTWAASLAKVKDKVSLPETITSKALKTDFLADKQSTSSSQSSEPSTLDDPQPTCSATSISSLPGNSSTPSSLHGTSSRLSPFPGSNSSTSPLPGPSCSTSLPVTSSSLFSISSSSDDDDDDDDDEPLVMKPEVADPSPVKNIPTVKLSEILTPQKVYCDSDQQRIWLNGDREGESFIVNPGVRRVIPFSGEFQPVSRSCNAPLDSGGLCPRKDRFKCPFHGVIVDRDAEGNPTASTEVKGEPTKTAEKKKPKRRAKLRSDASLIDNSRQRLEKKVFNKSTVKRISRRLDVLDSKRTKSLFSEQFNYSM